MKIQKALKHAFNMVIHSKLRSWLTILGIVIGVAAVIAIVSIGEGMEQSFNNQFDALGGDLITLTAGNSRSGGFGGRMRFDGGSGGGATEEEVVIDRADLQALKGIADLELISTQIRGNVDVTFLGRTGSVTLNGVDQKVWSDITTSKIREGRFLDSADSNVIVVGGRLADSYFEQPLGINKMITIEESSFRIVGILDDTSTSIYMPINLAYQIIDDKENGVYDSIVMKVKDEDNLDATIEKVESKLMLTRHVTEKTKDFSISSNQQSNEARQEMMSSMTLFLTAIAAVSLIVGTVGIANTMFTSVLEKTKEIGIMKAIGARNRDILLIFIFNAALIGLVGGIIGVIFGIMLSGMLPALLGDIGFFRGGTLVSVNSILVALSVSVFVGILAGIVPAWQGSKLKPVDALRYE